MSIEEKFLQMMQQPLWKSLVVLIAAALLVLVVKGILFKWLRRLSQKTDTQFDDLIVSELEKNILPLIYGLPFYFALRVYDQSPRLEKFYDTSLALAGVFFGVRFLVAIITFGIEYYLQKTDGDLIRVQNFKALATVLKIMMWVTASVFVLDNLGFRVTSVLAGLGVGGVAIALAAQATMGDFFSYLIIIFDRPFEVGHSISSGDVTGTVESIGIKTTRVRSINGELVVFPNSLLTSRNLFNYQALPQRRSLLKIVLVYDTPLEKLKIIPLVLKEAVETLEQAQFDRAYLSQPSDNGIVFELVFFVAEADLRTVQLVQQNVWLKIIELFNREGILLAYNSAFSLASKNGGVAKATT